MKNVKISQVVFSFTKVIILVVPLLSLVYNGYKQNILMISVNYDT
jgi:hypothetical protein